jgi:hypothetical protein
MSLLLLSVYTLLGISSYLWGSFFFYDEPHIGITTSISLTIFAVIAFFAHLIFQLIPSVERLPQQKVTLAIVSALFIPLLIIAFAHAYRAVGLPNVTQKEDFVYFSIVTFTTLGYGDISPIGWARLFAVLQAISGFLFVPLLISQLWSASKEAEEEKRQETDNILDEVREIIARND